MKLTIEFGHNGRHSLRKQNAALQKALEVMAAELERAKFKIASVENHADAITQELNKLLKEKRAARERALRGLSGGLDSTTETKLPVVSNVVPIKNGGKARFQLINGGLEP